MNDQKKEKKKPTVDVEELPLQLSFFGFEVAPIIRPEYNIGKFAGIIFASPYSKDLNKPRDHKWTVKVGEDTAEASVTITPQYGLNTPTTTTLRVYLALLQIWTANGQPEDGIINFSSRQLGAVIGWRWGGAETAKRIADHIKILKSTGITWVWSYKQVSGQLDRKVSDISILSSAEYSERKTLLRSERFSPVQRVRLNPDLVDNMLKGHVRPINYKALQTISNDTALNLYTRIDIYLSKRPKWERRSQELLRDELKLVGKRWESRSLRHAKLKEFVKQLNNVELGTGRLKLSIEKTNDGTDWKLVAVKIKTKPTQNRVYIKPIVSMEEAKSIAEDVITTIRNTPKPGNPRIEYFKYICHVYPAPLIYQALSIAKSDYQGKIETNITSVFIYELKKIIRSSKEYKWYKDISTEEID